VSPPRADSIFPYALFKASSSFITFFMSFRAAATIVLVVLKAVHTSVIVRGAAVREASIAHRAITPGCMSRLTRFFLRMSTYSSIAVSRTMSDRLNPWDCMHPSITSVSAERVRSLAPDTVMLCTCTKRRWAATGPTATEEGEVDGAGFFL